MTSPFKEFEEKNQVLQAQFKTAPKTIIHGVVDASGLSAGKNGNEKLWSLNLTLIAWRTDTSSLQNVSLAITKQVSDEELRQLQEQIEAETIVTLRVRLCENSPFGDARALFIELLPSQSDAELEAALVEYKKPLQINDSLFGVLTFDRSVEWFEGQVTWLGQTISLSVSLDESGSYEDALNTAKALFADMSTWSEKVCNYAVQELLPLKNDNWLDDDEDPVTPEAFIECMQLESITCDPGGEFSFWHDDGDLFWGHSIQISGSLSEGLTDADIPG